MLEGSDLVDRLVPFDKFIFDRPARAAWALPAAVTLGRRLREQRYDTLLLFHHLTTVFGTAKYAALALASGAPVRAGLDNGRGRFLTHRAEDCGFGERHEVDYWLAVAGAIGATNPRPRLEMPISPDQRAAARQRWADLGLGAAPTALLTLVPEPSAWPAAGRPRGTRHWAIAWCPNWG